MSSGEPERYAMQTLEAALVKLFKSSVSSEQNSYVPNRAIPLGAAALLALIVVAIIAEVVLYAFNAYSCAP